MTNKPDKTNELARLLGTLYAGQTSPTPHPVSDEVKKILERDEELFENFMQGAEIGNRHKLNRELGRKTKGGPER